METFLTPITRALLAVTFLLQFYNGPVELTDLRMNSPAAAAPAGAEAPDHAAALGSARPATAAVQDPVSPPLDDLTCADRLAIRFQGYPELTGDYRVNADGTVSIPVLGRVSVSRLDAAGLEQVLARMATEIVGQDSYVTVEIASYRPVFVTGFVKNPGAVQWHPGLSVLQALVLAGGTPPAGGTPGSANEANGPLSASLAALARLRAEQHGAATIDVPPKLANLIGAAAAAALIADQQSLLTTRRSTLETQLASLERGKVLVGQELEAMRAQRTRVDAQLRVQREQRQSVKEQLAKGRSEKAFDIGRGQLGVDQDAKVLDLEEKGTKLTVDITKAENKLAGLEWDASNLKLERQAAIDAEILKLERESAQFDGDFETAKGTPDKAEEGGMPTHLAVRPKPLTYELVRQGMNKPTKVADQFSSLKPGDILIVSQGEL